MSEDFRRQSGNVWRKLSGAKPSGHGPHHEAEGGWVDPKPYVDVMSDGTFEGYDNSQWLYFRFPESVKVQWTKDPEDAMRNQHFFVDLVNQLSLRLNNLSDSEKGDERRAWHITSSRELFEGIKPHESHLPLMRDYLRRMSEQYGKPEWHGYMGIKLIASNGMEEAHGMRAKMERWWELTKNPEDLPMHLYQADRNDVTALMLDHGFRTLDFASSDGFDDYKRITAWPGVDDDNFSLHKALVTTRMQEPLHGRSIITPRWGEVTMSAIKPSEERFMIDPISEGARWVDPIYNPGNNVVVLSMRGEIRSKRVADAMLENKYMVKQGSQKRGKKPRAHSDAERREMSVLDRAQEFSKIHAMLDNVEIIVGTVVTDDRAKNSQLSRSLHDYGLSVHPLVNRQPIALNSTFPTYPKPILPHRRSNRTRPVLSNQMFPGIIAMSGVFRKTKPNCDRGFLVGLSDGGSEYAEIWTDIEGAAKENGTPGFLYTGRPGAGKTQTMLQHLAQNRYNGYRCFYLNPKPSSSLRSFFDMMGGATVSISEEYLSENPGCMDPVFFLSDRASVASLLSDAIYILAELGSERGTEAAKDLSQLNAEIRERSSDPRNACSGDIIFGRADEGEIAGISSSDIKEIVSNTMRSSAFWKAFIATGRTDSKLYREMRGEGSSAGLATLIEWDRGLELPSKEDVMSGNRLSSKQVDSIISVTAAFSYATEITGHNRAGGSISVDEAWVLLLSETMKNKLNAGLREFRERNIMLALGTQRIGDFMTKGDNNMATYFSRFLLMAISDNDPDELDLYYELTGLPRTRANTQYILGAGAKKIKNGKSTGETERTVPRAYYIDRIYEYEGGVLMGPWPDRELNAGRTDKDAYMRRREEAIAMASGGLIGSMGQLGADIMSTALMEATRDEAMTVVEEVNAEDDRTN